MSKGTLEQKLQNDAGIGISITWLWDGGVDPRLVHKNGVIAAEGNVNAVAKVLPRLEGAIKKHFPKANYGHTHATEMAHDGVRFAWSSEGDTARH